MRRFINKLIGRQNTKELEVQGVPTAELLSRRTGRSLAIVLRTIGETLQNPGVWVSVIDHYPSHMRNIQLLDEIDEVIAKLGLRHIVVRKAPPSIKFDLFEEVEEGGYMKDFNKDGLTIKVVDKRSEDHRAPLVPQGTGKEGYYQCTRCGLIGTSLHFEQIDCCWQVPEEEA